MASKKKKIARRKGRRNGIIANEVGKQPANKAKAASPTKKKDKKSAANLAANTAGLVTTIGSQLPLTQETEGTSSLRKSAAGLGAGTRKAQATANRDLNSIAQASRDVSPENQQLAFRQALRAQENQASRNAETVGQVSSKEAHFANKALQAEDLRRREATAKIGSSIAGGVSALTAQSFAQEGGDTPEDVAAAQADPNRASQLGAPGQSGASQAQAEPAAAPNNFAAPANLQEGNPQGGTALGNPQGSSTETLDDLDAEMEANSPIQGDRLVDNEDAVAASQLSQQFLLPDGQEGQGEVTQGEEARIAGNTPATSLAQGVTNQFAAIAAPSAPQSANDFSSLGSQGAAALPNSAVASRTAGIDVNAPLQTAAPVQAPTTDLGANSFAGLGPQGDAALTPDGFGRREGGSGELATLGQAPSSGQVSEGQAVQQASAQQQQQAQQELGANDFSSAGEQQGQANLAAAGGFETRAPKPPRIDMIKQRFAGRIPEELMEGGPMSDALESLDDDQLSGMISTYESVYGDVSNPAVRKRFMRDIMLGRGNR